MVGQNCFRGEANGARLMLPLGKALPPFVVGLMFGSYFLTVCSQNKNKLTSYFASTKRQQREIFDLCINRSSSESELPLFLLASLYIQIQSYFRLSA